MRVGICYGIISAGGCERRMGDLCRWLLDNGDEAWIVGTNFSDLGRTMMHQYCDVPAERILLTPSPTYAIEDFAREMATELEWDIADAQYAGMLGADMPCRKVYTSHGHTQPVPTEHGYSALISVEHLAPHLGHAQMMPVYAEIWNWVPLERFPYREELGEGAAFVGRSMKMINALKVAEQWGGQIDGYGTVPAALPEHMPSNLKWWGWADSAEVIPRYRLIFGSAMVSLEAMAAGRFCIAGQEYDKGAGYIAEGCLVTPDNMEALSGRQYAFRGIAPASVEPTGPEVYADFIRAMESDMPELRRECRAYVEREHSKDGQCRKIRQIYEEVLGL